MNSLGIIISRLTDLNVIALLIAEGIENFELELSDFLDLQKDSPLLIRPGLSASRAATRICGEAFAENTNLIEQRLTKLLVILSSMMEYDDDDGYGVLIAGFP
jgi:hypothetical protein